MESVIATRFGAVLLISAWVGMPNGWWLLLRAACKSQKWSSRSLADKLTCGHRARPRANHFQKLPFPAWIWPCFTWVRGFGCDAVHPVAPSSGGAFWACDVHVGQRLQTQWPTYGATFTTSPIPTFQMTQAPASKLQPIGLLDRGTPSRLTCELRNIRHRGCAGHGIAATAESR